MMEKNMNLLLLIFTFIINWIVSASFWALYFLFTVPFFHEELAGNYKLLTERILQLSLACVLGACRFIGNRCHAVFLCP